MHADVNKSITKIQQKNLTVFLIDTAPFRTKDNSAIVGELNNLE